MVRYEIQSAKKLESANGFGEQRNEKRVEMIESANMFFLEGQGIERYVFFLCRYSTVWVDGRTASSAEVREKDKAGFGTLRNWGRSNGGLIL